MIRYELRMARGLKKQSEVAGAIGIKQQTLSKIERGMMRPSAKIVWRLAEYYGKPVKELFPDIFLEEDMEKDSNWRKQTPKANSEKTNH